MNPDQPNNGGGASSGSAGKKKSKKNRNNPDDLKLQNLQIDQKNQGQHLKQPEEQLKTGKNDGSVISETTTLQNKPMQKQNQPKEPKQQCAQQQNPSKDAKMQPAMKQNPPKDAKQQPSQKQNPPKEAKQQPAQKQNPPKEAKQQPAQKQNPPKGVKQEPAQKQNLPKESKSSAKTQHAKGENAPANTPGVSQLSAEKQSIEQTIEIYRRNLAIPKRKNPKVGGTLGRATEIEVNHLPLNLEKLFKKTVYHIDVKFTPELPRKLLRVALEEFNKKHYKNLEFAFDGRRNMYSTKDVKGMADTISVLNEENNKTIDYNIVTSVVNVISMKKIEDYLKSGSSNSPPGEAFQALDIVLKNRPFALRFTNAGRSFFPVPRTIPVDLGEGMELWKGFFQSPVMGWKPYLNIDVANKGFPKYQSLVEYIKYDLNYNLDSAMDNWGLNSLSSYVKGLKVDFMIPNQPNTKRSYKVVGLLDSPIKFYFEMEEPETKIKKTINVVTYFKNTRNYAIRYPNLPCLHVGNINKKTAIPIELCIVQRGQLRMKKLTDNQTAIMVKNAARPPAERRQAIEQSIKDIKYNEDAVLKEFGVSVSERFASIPARILEQPSLAYAHKETKPKSGVWRADKFSKPIVLEKWVILNLDGARTKMQSLKDFEKYLKESGFSLNVNVQPMSPAINLSYNRPRLDDVQRDVIKNLNSLKGKVDLVVVVIPDFPQGVYATVKQCSELTVGVLTQCIKSRTMYKMNRSTSDNILLKINSKLNGINHTLATKSSPPSMEGAIIFGADVTHPSPDQTTIPSVAAVAASHDLKGSQYNMEWRLQDPKMEIIQELEDIVYIQLVKFKDKTKTVPKKIFYFRDGVSEGQFLQLLESELISIRRACLRLNINYKPAVTFLVVQKRHHTRMFPKFNMDMDGKFANVPSGTIIDTQITHPTELDFYLCSHASIQGTSRPTKYHLIWDDNNFSEDQLEQLTFYLCFMFVRCTRSVSYPAPTYYAHLAAFRARAYIENKSINLNDLHGEQKKNLLNTSISNNTPMYFV